MDNFVCVVHTVLPNEWPFWMFLSLQLNEFYLQQHLTSAWKRPIMVLSGSGRSRRPAAAGFRRKGKMIYGPWASITFFLQSSNMWFIFSVVEKHVNINSEGTGCSEQSLNRMQQVTFKTFQDHYEGHLTPILHPYGQKNKNMEENWNPSTLKFFQVVWMLLCGGDLLEVQELHGPYFFKMKVEEFTLIWCMLSCSEILIRM